MRGRDDERRHDRHDEGENAEPAHYSIVPDATTLSTSSRTRRAYSSGVTSHGSTRIRPAAPRRSASARSESTRASASASAPASPGGTSSPVSPSATTSGIPPTRLATTARPRQRGLDHDAAHSLRARREDEQRRRVERGGDLLRGQRRRPLDAGPAARRRAAAASGASVPWPTTCRAASGTARPRGATPPRARRRPCSARARRRRARAEHPGAARRGCAVKGSRSMNAGNSAAGSMPSARTSSVVYALIVLHAVRAAQRAARERVGEGIEKPPRPRAVEPASARASRRAGRGSTALFELARRRATSASAVSCAPCAMTASGSKPPKLARDPPGEPQVVERAVEQPDRGAGARATNRGSGEGFPSSAVPS